MKPSLICIAGMLLAVPILFVEADRSSTRTEPVVLTQILDNDQVAQLLERPRCIEDFDAASETWTIEKVPVVSKGVTLSGELYLPLGEARVPLVILVSGGFNEEDLIMRAPRYYAPRLAHCGFAAYVYWKRGTGPSGGIFAEATYDDFIDDIVGIAEALSSHSRIDPGKIGVQGGSSGGLFGSVAAARSKLISFMINTSGPIVSGEEEANYNIHTALQMRGYPDSLVEKVMPIWRRHHAAWAHGDTLEHRAIAAEVYELRKQYDPAMLPTPFEEVFRDSSLAFLWPTFRSAGRDYLSELKGLKARWLSIYGERDRIVPVASCVENIERLGAVSRASRYDVIVLPGVGHSFVNPDTRRQVPVVRIILNWLSREVHAVEE